MLQKRFPCRRLQNRCARSTSSSAADRRAYRQINFRFLRHLRTESVPWFREFRPHISGNMFWTLGGFNESYLVHFDNHFAFENGAFFQLPGFNLTGEGLEEPFAIREGIIIPAGTYNNIDWEFRANTNHTGSLERTGILAGPKQRQLVVKYSRLFNFGG